MIADGAPSRASLRRARLLRLRTLALLAELAGELDVRAIADLQARVGHTARADGFPTSSLAAGGSHGGSERTSAVEVAVIARNDCRQIADPIGAAGVELFVILEELGRLCRRAHALVAVIRRADP